MADDMADIIGEIKGLADYLEKAANAIESTPESPDIAKEIAEKLGANLDKSLRPTMTPMFATKEEATAFAAKKKEGDTSEYDLAELIEKQIGDSLR